MVKGVTVIAPSGIAQSQAQAPKGQGKAAVLAEAVGSLFGVASPHEPIERLAGEHFIDVVDNLLKANKNTKGLHDIYEKTAYLCSREAFPGVAFAEVALQTARPQQLVQYVTMPQGQPEIILQSATQGAADKVQQQAPEFVRVINAQPGQRQFQLVQEQSAQPQTSQVLRTLEAQPLRQAIHQPKTIRLIAPQPTAEQIIPQQRVVCLVPVSEPEPQQVESQVVQVLAARHPVQTKPVRLIPVVEARPQEVEQKVLQVVAPQQHVQPVKTKGVRFVSVSEVQPQQMDQKIVQVVTAQQPVQAETIQLIPAAEPKQQQLEQQVIAVMQPQPIVRKVVMQQQEQQPVEQVAQAVVAVAAPAQQLVVVQPQQRMVRPSFVQAVRTNLGAVIEKNKGVSYVAAPAVRHPGEIVIDVDHFGITPATSCQDALILIEQELRKSNAKALMLVGSMNTLQLLFNRTSNYLAQTLNAAFTPDKSPTDGQTHVDLLVENLVSNQINVADADSLINRMKAHFQQVSQNVPEAASQTRMADYAAQEVDMSMSDESGIASQFSETEASYGDEESGVFTNEDSF